MLRGFYGAASGMIAQQRRTEMLTDNLSNLQTPGYKAEQGSIRTFPEMLIKAQNASTPPGRQTTVIGELATGVYMQDRTPVFTQGDLEDTGLNTDVALFQEVLPEDGALFFSVATGEDEPRYTRNGNWAVDGEGFLTTSQGFYILGDDGEPLEVGNENFTVRENGTVTDQDGNDVGRLQVAYAENPNDLVKEGNSLFRMEEDDGELPTAIGNEDIEFQIRQGYLERSNVTPGQTMTDLLQSYRLFESNQRILQAYDQSMQRAVNDIGRLG